MVPEDTVKNLIDSCTKLIQKVQTISDENYSDSNNQHKFSDIHLLDIMPLATVWAITAKNVTLSWFNKTYGEAAQNMLYYETLSWFAEPNKTIRDAEKKWRNDKDPNKGGNPKNGMQMALLNDNAISIEEKKSRLKSLIQTYDLDDQKGLVKYVLSRLENEDEIFNYLFESKVRKYVFQIINIKHISERVIEKDTDRQKKLYKDLNILLSEKGFEKKLKNLTEILVLMTLFLTSKENLSNEQAVNDYINECMKKFDYKISDNSNAIRNAGILSRIKRLKWGPEDFVRDPKIIKKAQDILNEQGILTLGGLGAVGKTALANKLTLEAAKKYQYDYYVIRSTKVGSNQGDLDPDSENMISATNSTNNIASSMLRDDGSISGSIERICEDILLAQNGDFDVRGYDTEELIKKAIEAMKKDSYLITIDNYEDIEDPDFEGLDNSEIQLIFKQQDFFAYFFQTWSKEYNSRVEKNSRIIITTRGKGKDTENEFFRVPALSLNENKELFKRKLESRRNENFIDDGVYVYAVQEIRDQVENEFKRWTMPVEAHADLDFPSNEYKFQPAYTIFAACGIRTKQNEKDGVLEQIKYWDPKGEGAKRIRTYVTEKVFGGIPREQIYIFAKLLAKGKIFVFDYNKIMELSKDLDESWSRSQAVEFVNEFERHRDFFVKHINVGNYGWNQFYFYEIIDHFRTKHNVLLNEELQKERDKKIDGKDKREYTPIVYQRERNNIMTWLATGTLTTNIEGTNITFNSCMLRLLDEKDLNEQDLAQALMMIIGNKSLQIREKVYNSLFPGKPPENNLFEMFRQSTMIKGKSRGYQNALYDTKQTLFVNANFRLIWNYFINILEQFTDRMMNNQQHYEILNLYNAVREDAEECVMSEKSIIDKWDLRNFYKQIINNLNQFKQYCIPTEIQDFESISHRILMRYINLLEVLPKSDEGISFDLSYNQLKDKQKPSEVEKITDYMSMKLDQLREHAKTKGINRYSSMNKDELLSELAYDRTDLRAHYKVIIEFVNNYVDFNGTHDDLLGNVFWLSLRYIAIQDGSSSLEITERRDLQNKLKSYIGLGAKVAKLNFAFLESIVDKVMRSFEQVTWNLDEIIDESIFRYGGLKGKLIRYNPGNDYQNLNREIVILGLENLLHNDSEPSEGIYKIRSIDSSNIYLIPQVNESGNTINEHEQLSSIDEIRNIIYKYFEQNAKTFKSPMKWSEFKSKIPHKELFSELDDVDRFDEKEYRFFTDIILSEKRKISLGITSFTTESSILYVKFGTFSDREQEKLQIYKWETIDVNEECKNAITRQATRFGFGLPKNPKDVDMLVDEYMQWQSSNSRQRWEDFKKKIVSEKKHLQEHSVRRFIKILQQISGSANDSDYMKPITSDKTRLINSIISMYEKTATYLTNNKGDAYEQINEVFEVYFWKLRWGQY